MANSNSHSKYRDLLNKLSLVITAANQKLLALEPDPFFTENANFYTKSFLVSMCAYLESYLKDVLMIIVDDANSKLMNVNIPHNLVKWSMDPEKNLKENDMQYIDLKINITRKKLDEHISGNPHRTKELFKKFGIQLSKDTLFENQIEKIQTIVTKRNDVMHHDDDASDLSNSDLLINVNLIIDYITNIDNIVLSFINLHH